jgi:hypothetical protein
MRKHLLLAHDVLFVGSYAALFLSAAMYCVYVLVWAPDIDTWDTARRIWEACAARYAFLVVGITISHVTLRDWLVPPTRF